jgi:ribosomal protein S8
MSLVNLSHVCSHLQNASKARLGKASIPMTKMHLRLALAMQKQGLVSTVDLGGTYPPEKMVPAPESIERLADHIAEKPWDAYPWGNDLVEKEVESLKAERTVKAVTYDDYLVKLHEKPQLKDCVEVAKLKEWQNPEVPQNPALRKIWLGLKYWNNHPVLSELKMVSKPSRRITENLRGLQKIVKGFNSGYIKGLKRPGECLFVSTEIGILEARECVQRRIGGTVLCRAI